MSVRRGKCASWNGDNNLIIFLLDIEKKRKRRRNNPCYIEMSEYHVGGMAVELVVWICMCMSHECCPGHSLTRMRQLLKQVNEYHVWHVTAYDLLIHWILNVSFDYYPCALTAVLSNNNNVTKQIMRVQVWQMEVWSMHWLTVYESWDIQWHLMRLWVTRVKKKKLGSYNSLTNRTHRDIFSEKHMHMQELSIIAVFIIFYNQLLIIPLGVA